MAHICKRPYATLELFAGGIRKKWHYCCPKQRGGGAKEDVDGFTRRSRQSLMEKIAMSSRVPDMFVTLTYGAVWPTPQVAKEQLRRFVDALIRYVSAKGTGKKKSHICVMWRMEAQRRGAPHFHLMIWTDWVPSRSEVGVVVDAYPVGDVLLLDGKDEWHKGVPMEKCLRRSREWGYWLRILNALWFHHAYYELGGAMTVEQKRDHARRGVDLSFIANERHAWRYISKYSAKQSEAEYVTVDGEIVPSGRCWGIKGAKEWVGFSPLGRYKLDPVSADALMAEIAIETENDYAITMEQGERTGYFAFMDRKKMEQLMLDIDAMLDKL